MANPRNVAASVLTKIERDKAYSNITLAAFFKEYELSPEDKRLATNLIYGVLDRKITLDYILSKFMKTPIKKTAPFTLSVLRSALYQIMYMDKIPESAAVDEAVKLVKKSKESRNSGFVNAVLRAVLRNESVLPEGNGAAELSVRYSCPEWIVNSFIKDYGLENTIALLEESLKAPPFTVRVNTLKCGRASLNAEFNKLGIKCIDNGNENSFDLAKGIDVLKNSLYQKGWFYVQDLASQKAVSVLAPKKGDRVLDMCAAPGGKSFTMAQLMENEGELIACDLYEHRTKLIEQGAARLGINIIKTCVSDATEYNDALGSFDCILCDVPCSGWGVLRRKPDIKYKTDNDFSNLQEIQYKILCNAVRYLKKGGRILYSTCTLRADENEKLVIRFQKEYNNFHKIYEHSFMPHIDGTDGFYCVLLENTDERA